MSLEEEEYLELLNAHLKGTLSNEEREALYAMAKADPSKNLLLAYLVENKEQKNSELEAEIIYEKTQPNDLKVSAIHIDNFSSKSLLWKKYKYAILAACLLCFLSVVWLVGDKQLPAVSTADWTEMSTAKGERKFFRMSDGTEIWLNSESSLRVKKGYGKEHRTLELLGEAHFSVTKNKDLPLYLNVLGNEIEVLGTVFNVRAYPEEKKMATSLVEGKVKLHVLGEDGKRDYILNPGDKVEVANKLLVEQSVVEPIKRKAEILSPSSDDVEYKKIAVENKEALEVMWVHNKLVFNDDSFQDVVKSLERWYDRKIVLEIEGGDYESFSGVFQERTCEQVLDLLQKTGGKFKYHVDNEIIYIK